MIKSFSLLIIGLSMSATAWAFPKAPVDSLDWEPVEVLGSAMTDYDFNGIVKLSNCSASLVHFTGQPKSSKAYVLTNGHCINAWGGFLGPGEIVYNRRDTRSMRAYRTLDDTVSVRAETLVYATMTGTDAALYRLTSTYEDLEAQGIHSFEMNFERPASGTDIHVVSGYWKRGFACSIDGFVYRLLEAQWTFEDSLRYSETGCDIYGGTSGSPVIAAGERLVVGVNNTENESGQQCTMNNPCEVDENGQKTVIQNRGYGQQTWWFYSCLTLDFQIDLNKEGCLLHKGE